MKKIIVTTIFLHLMMVFSFAQDCDNIPVLNEKIVGYVKDNMGKKVDRGECWDVAAGALNQYDAKWDKAYKFGKKVDPKSECIFPGDIIQFEGVRIDYKKDGMVYWETMGHHTAIVYEVKAKGDYVIAAQNTKTSGRKVGVSDLKLDQITKGKYTFFRPTK
ncbi:MAG: hypothetical protein MRY83_20230 [Flavobacteriales bacterium]|nr:hypothetical protein [Flavobacteriales bacterium]